MDSFQEKDFYIAGMRGPHSGRKRMEAPMRYRALKINMGVGITNALQVYSFT